MENFKIIFAAGLILAAVSGASAQGFRINFDGSDYAMLAESAAAPAPAKTQLPADDMGKKVAVATVTAQGAPARAEAPSCAKENAAPALTTKEVKNFRAEPVFEQAAGSFSAQAEKAEMAGALYADLGYEVCARPKLV